MAPAGIGAAQPSSSCIVPVSHLRSLQPRQDKINYDEIVRHFGSFSRVNSSFLTLLLVMLFLINCFMNFYFKKTF